MTKLMIEFPAYTGNGEKYFEAFDAMEILRFNQTLKDGEPEKDKCHLEFKNGRSVVLAVGYDEFKRLYVKAFDEINGANATCSTEEAAHVSYYGVEGEKDMSIVVEKKEEE